MFKYTKLIFAIILGGIITSSCMNKEQIEKGYIGKSDIQIKDGKMTPEVLLAFGRLSDPQLSPNKEMILYGVSYTSIPEDRSCRNIFVTSVDGQHTQQLTFAGHSISNARWSEDGKRIYFIQQGQIYSAPLIGNQIGSLSLGKKTQISSVERGVSEFTVSPTADKVMYVSTVPSDVKTPKDFDPNLTKAKAYVTEDLMYRHWDHWVTELPHTFVAPWPEKDLVNGKSVKKEINEENSVDILGGPQVKFELPIEPFSGISELCWNPQGDKIAYSCKKLKGKQYAFSTNTEIYIYDTNTKETTQVSHNGGYDTNPVWSPDGNKLAWLSMERDGYEADKIRLIVADISNNQAYNIKDYTQDFKYNVEGILWGDNNSIYFSALTEGLKAAYRLDIAQNEITRLTSDKLMYDFQPPFALTKDNKVLTTYCSMDFPNEIVEILGYDSIKQITNENKAILDQLKPHKIEPRYIKTVDGKDMLTWIVYPPDFDPNKKYPAIEILLGGPQGTLSQGWSYRWNYRLMSNQGYIVILPNRRGTTAFGPEWTEQISGDYVGLNMQDYLSAAKEMKKEPYIGKLAGCGASYGGFSAYYLAGIHNNVYDCFISHAGIFDERYLYFETEEMWFPNWDNGGLTEYKYTPNQQGSAGDGITFGGMMQAGSPWSSKPKAVRHYDNSPSKNVTNWNTPILCIHGGNDFRIPYDQGMAAFNCAQMMGVPSKLIIFPNENHWILKPQNAIFWHRSYFDWLDRWCKDKQPNDVNNQ